MAQSENIYPSITKGLLLTLSCLLFVIAGYQLIDNAHNFKMIIGGVCGLLFMIGVPIGIYIIILSISKQPIIKIFEDRVENFTINKGWETIYFQDVEIFILENISGVNVIKACYLDNMTYPDKPLNSSLVDNKDTLCQLLNKKLEEYDNGKVGR